MSPVFTRTSSTLSGQGCFSPHLKLGELALQSDPWLLVSYLSVDEHLDPSPGSILPIFWSLQVFSHVVLCGTFLGRKMV